jgi:hypothetical protein
MAGHTGIYVPTLLEFQYKCGANCSATSKAEAYANSFIQQAENYINVACRTIFAVDTTTFTALDAGTKLILTEAASNIAAIYAIQYDMSGFSSRQEALIMINILWARAQECMKVLIEERNRTFLTEA